MSKLIKRELPDGAWKDFLPHALSIIEDIKRHDNKIYGGKTLLWDQSAALYIIYPEIFKKHGGPGGHYEAAVSPEEFRTKWTQATNQAKTYK